MAPGAQGQDVSLDGLGPLLEALSSSGVDVTVIAGPALLEDPNATILAWITRSVLWAFETGEVTEGEAKEAASRLALAGARLVRCGHGQRQDLRGPGGSHARGAPRCPRGGARLVELGQPRRIGASRDHVVARRATTAPRSGHRGRARPTCARRRAADGRSRSAARVPPDGLQPDPSAPLAPAARSVDCRSERPNRPRDRGFARPRPQPHHLGGRRRPRGVERSRLVAAVQRRTGVR